MQSLLGSILNATPVSFVRESRFGGPESGVSADPRSQSNLAQMEATSTLFAIVDGLASGVAEANWNLYRGEGPTLDDDPDAEIVDVHPAKSLWEKPNPFYTRGEFIEALQQHYELTGEYWWVLSRQGTLAGRPVRAQFPLEMWVVRPDRMRPVPHETKFLTGFLYRSSGDEIALALDEVIFNKRQNPLDPYRGLSPIASLLWDIEGERAASIYNAAFFRNGAMPGGVITEIDDLSDPEFDQLLNRWNAQHKGAGNAHRVGILEKGKYTPLNYTRKDMEFIDLRKFSKETIREAYRFPRSMMGTEAASNRATHEAEKLMFAENLIAPRLRRLRQSLNDDLLPMFGSLGDGYFFDFSDPSPEDPEREVADRDSAVNAVATLVPLGFDPAESLEAFGLPELTFSKPAPPPAPSFPPNDPDAPPEEDPDEPAD